MYVRNTNWSKFIIFYLADIVSYVASFFLAYAIRFGLVTGVFERNEYSIIFLAYGFMVILFPGILGLMNNALKRNLLYEFLTTLLLSLCALSTTTLILFAFKISEAVSRLFLLYITVVFLIIDYLVSGVLTKKLYLAFLKNEVRKGGNLPTAFLIANMENAEKFLHEIQEVEIQPLHIRGVKFTDTDYKEEKFNGLHVCHTYEEAESYICRGWIDEVVICVESMSRVPDTFMEHCREMGLTVHYIVDIGGVNSGKQFVEEFSSYSSLTTAFNYISPRQAIVKRAADILGGLVGSIFAVLIGIVIGPIIFIASPGPILFRQKRVGKNGRYFYLLKFRSMTLNAEDKKQELMKENRISDGMMFKLNFDPRIIGNRILPDGTKKTGIGEFIRKTSLDEFPQFFNVLKGDMSLVGTRPPTLDEWEKYEFHHRARLAMKPGITGLWQISGRSNITDFEEVVRLDTEYIANYRLALDAEILFKTIPAMLRGKGAM